MKSSFAPRLALCLLAVALLAAGGCAYTTVTAKERVHAVLPPVKAGLRAVMPPVVDRRVWAAGPQGTPIPDVRLFAPEITEDLRRGLVEKGLFAALPAPSDPQARGLGSSLQIEVTAFGLNKLGSNAWVVPHLLLDGLALPVFTGAAIYSQGRVDLGSYLLPSNRMGTSMTVKLLYGEGGDPLVEKEYNIQEEIEQVSDRKYLETINDSSTHGVTLSRQEGRKALVKLTQAIAGDPVWQFLPQLRRLAAVERMLKDGKPVDQVAAAVEDLLPLLDTPLTYLEEETKVMRDGYLDAKARAGVINDLRARWLGLAEVKDLPAAQRINEERAEQLFDDPQVPRYQVEANLAERVIVLALGVISPKQPGTSTQAASVTTWVVPPVGFRAPAAGVAPELSPGAGRPAAALPRAPAAGPALAPLPMGLPAAQAQALRQHLSQALAQRVRGDLRLQVLLVHHAEKAVGEAWEPMQALLKQVGGAYVDKYLNTRKS